MSAFPLSVLLLIPAAHAGGMHVQVAAPADLAAAALPGDAVLVARVVGCHASAAGTVAGKAEALVNGARVSEALRLQPLDDGWYAVLPPTVGDTWVAALTGTDGQTTVSSIVPVTDGHFDSQRIVYSHTPPITREVDGAVARLFPAVSTRP